VRQAIIRSILWWFKLQEGFADFPVLNRFNVGTNCICIIFVIACSVEVLFLFGSLFFPLWFWGDTFRQDYVHGLNVRGLEKPYDKHIGVHYPFILGLCL
jgi:hypothetical protein